MATSDLLIPVRFRSQIGLFLKQPAQALLIVAPAGSGKASVATYIATKLLGSNAQSHPYFLHITRQTAKQEIAIEAIRELIQKLKLKTPGQQAIRRVILIENAELMSAEAQNALLKILEEPPSDTVFILTAPNQSNLLPTIVSRTQVVHLPPTGLDETIQYFGAQTNRSNIEKAWLLSDGSIGLTSALLSKDEEHPLKQGVEQAKVFLRSKPYERLLMLRQIENRVDMDLFLDSLGRVLASLHRSAVTKDQKTQVGRLLESRKLVKDSRLKLQANVAPRLITTDVALNLAV